MLCLAGVAMAGSLSAQEAPVRLTLDEAIAGAVANSQRVAELVARREAADAAEAGRRALTRPIVSAIGNYTRTNHVDEFAIAQPGLPPRVLYPDIPDNFRARVDLQWPIYSGGRTDALTRAARAEREAAGEDLEAARADLRLEATRAFWALVTATETERVLARSIDSLDAHVRDLRARLEQGLIPPNDVLSAEAQRSRQQLLAIEARNTRAATEADLGRLLGLETAPRLETTAALEKGDVGAEAAEALIANARVRRPERRALEDRLAAALARAQAVGAAAKPQVGVNAGYDYARPNLRIFPRTDRWHDSWDVALTATWTLWDGGRRRADQLEAAAIARAAAARITAFERQVALDVRLRWLELDSSRAAIAAAGDGLRAAVEARRVVGERFRAGVATSTDVLDAEIAVLQAGLDRTRALAGARLAQARLDRAAGPTVGPGVEKPATR
jgi:outer membrane protein TolC